MATDDLTELQEAILAQETAAANASCGGLRFRGACRSSLSYGSAR